MNHNISSSMLSVVLDIPHLLKDSATTWSWIVAMPRLTTYLVRSVMPAVLGNAENTWCDFVAISLVCNIIYLGWTLLLKFIQTLKMARHIWKHARVSSCDDTGDDATAALTAVVYTANTIQFCMWLYCAANFLTNLEKIVRCRNRWMVIVYCELLFLLKHLPRAGQK